MVIVWRFLGGIIQKVERMTVCIYQNLRTFVCGNFGSIELIDALMQYEDIEQVKRDQVSSHMTNNRLSSIAGKEMAPNITQFGGYVTYLQKKCMDLSKLHMCFYKGKCYPALQLPISAAATAASKCI